MRRANSRKRKNRNARSSVKPSVDFGRSCHRRGRIYFTGGLSCLIVILLICRTSVFKLEKIGRLQTLSVIPTLPGDSISIKYQWKHSPCWS